MTGIFPILILNGRPAAGKNDLIHFLQGLPDDERRACFHIGWLCELDDFPMLWTWFEEGYILEHRLGRLRLHTDSDGYFVHNDLWHLLIERLSLEYDRLLRDAFDLHATHTVLIEFSRGSEHGGHRDRDRQGGSRPPALFGRDHAHHASSGGPTGRTGRAPTHLHGRAGRAPASYRAR